MFHTGMGRPNEFARIPDAILAYYEKNRGIAPEISILIGTDSQNFDQTKCVSVICVIAKGKGGIFFYRIPVPAVRVRILSGMLKGGWCSWKHNGLQNRSRLFEPGSPCSDS